MIEIAQRLRPFSHVPGILCQIPGSELYVESFPTLFRIWDFQGSLVKEIPFSTDHPLERFTVMQNLERNCVTIWSDAYHFHLLPNGESVFSKNPKTPLSSSQERLALGCHKKQEWEAIKKRLDFREIFPLWFSLGNAYKLPPRVGPDSGMFALLKECQEAITQHRPELIVPAFKKLFLAGFKGLFVPRLQDDDFQGLLPSHSERSVDSPLYLLTEGSKLIRSLFISSSENEVFILPNLPPEFFAGRMTKIDIRFGKLDLEWTKKMVRRMIFRGTSDGEIHFHFPSSLKSFRLKRSREDRGRLCLCGEPLEIKAGSLYLLDQFQK